MEMRLNLGVVYVNARRTRSPYYTVLEIPGHPPYMGGGGVFEGCFKALRYDLSILGYTDWKREEEEYG